MMWQNGRVTKKCERSNLAGNAHELTFSCYQNRSFLSKPLTCDWLVDAIEQAREELNFSLWAYVFMPDHVHLLMLPRNQKYYISQILRRIKQPVGIKAIRYLKQNNPSGLKQLATGQEYRKYRFWQKGGGYDRNITRMDTLMECLEYIHRNPVRKELVETPEQWRYSSAAEWAKTGSGPLRIDKEDWPIFC
jgi:REP-associated tyrosine transposase